MTDNWKISNEQMILLFGFLFFALGLLGFIQIGILESLSEIIPLSLGIMLVGILLLALFLLKNKQNKSKS